MHTHSVALLSLTLAIALGVRAEARAAPRGNPLWVIPLGALSETSERPIFSASRRPPAPSVAIATAPPAPAEAPRPQIAERPPLQLVGTISGGTLRLGLFLDEATREPMRLAVGESRDGWFLRAVSATDARFESAERTVTLALRVTTEARPEGDARPPEMPVPTTPSRRRRR
ncbi:general secretion pathway protein GspN [Bradyrhizobium guangdongense]|uniref:general secretion pathway protein GspN n=1 Tax=Bradyrhizobium guangdongense TaxID=1325090 RepID=UPI00112C5979|nr:general secretion pathway protein GspN [Bradyrhizobium guangdongense]TPQ36433.1 general secretion pathway protein GspN [Bradyrhizobium guangdongense]